MATQRALFTRSVTASGAAPARSRAFVLHGLLGSSRNWQGFAKSVVDAVPDLAITACDLRNHGHSTGFEAPHTLAAGARDVLQTARVSGEWPSVLIGHSMGGKMLLQLASDEEAMSEFIDHSPGGHVDVIVVDSYPGAKDGQRHHAHDQGHAAGHASAAGGRAPPGAHKLDGVETVLHIVKNAPLPIPSRQWVMDTAAAHGLDKGIALWLASNLRHLDGKSHGEGEGGPLRPASAAGHASTSSSGSGTGSGGFHWLFDPDTATQLFSDYLAVDHWPLLEAGPRAGVSLHLVMATRSSRWKDTRTQAALARVEAAQAAREEGRSGGAGQALRGDVHLHSVDAGHWVHVDNPAGLLRILAPRLTAAVARDSNPPLR